MTSSQPSCSLSGTAAPSMPERLLLRLTLGHESQLLKQPLRQSDAPAHTHQWRVYVTDANGEQLDSQLIHKVIFQLHDDFPNAKRVVKTPPFEVTETGYAGFTIPIYITFTTSPREYSLNYDLNLSLEAKHGSKIVRTLEFKDPKPALRQQLMKFGAEVYSAPVPQKRIEVKKKETQFENLFGPTITVQKKKEETKQAPKKPTDAAPRKRHLSGDLTTTKKQKTTQDTKPLATKAPKKKHNTDTSGGEAAIRKSSDIKKVPTAADKVSSTKSKKKSHPNLKIRISAPPESDSKARHQPSHSRSPKTPPSASTSIKSPSVATTGSDSKTLPTSIDTQLMAELMRNFGGDPSEAEVLAQRASQPVSPLFTYGDSPERMPSPSVSLPASTNISLLSTATRVSTPPRQSSKDKGEKKSSKKLKSEKSPTKRSKPTTAPPVGLGESVSAISDPQKTATEVTRIPIDGVRLKRLQFLQRRIMTLSSADLTYTVAATLIKNSVDYKLTDNSIEFDLCNLSPATIDSLETLWPI